MKYVQLLSTLLLLLVLNSSAQVLNTLRIDPSNLTGGTVSEIFDEANFIPLETSKYSLFSSIDQLEVTPQYFIILDKQTNALLIFNKNGKFHAKIKGERIGYKNGRTMTMFLFDSVTGVINIPSSSEENVMISFNYDAVQTGKHKSAFDSYSNVFYLANGVNFYNNYLADIGYTSLNTFELFVARKDSVLKRYFPYNRKYEPLTNRDILYGGRKNSFYYSGTESTALFVRSYDYNIYRLTQDSLNIAYQVVLPLKNTLPENFRSDTTLAGKRIKFLQNNPSLIYGISNVYQLGNHLFFNLKSWGYENNYSLVYNLHSGNQIDIQKISPDEKSFFFSITDSTVGGGEFINKGFLNTDGQYIYTSYSALRFFSQYELNSDKKSQLPPTLSNYLKKGSKSDNPLIIQLKPKAIL